jgi:hypothetical protein
MSAIRFVTSNSRYRIQIILWTSVLNAQVCLMTSQPTITPEAANLADLSLYSLPKATPVALQWTLQYSPSSITRLTVDDSPLLISRNKATICTGVAAAYYRLVAGANAKTIANGIIAKLTAIHLLDASRPTVQINNPMGISPEGYSLPIKLRCLPIAAYIRHREAGRQMKFQDLKKEAEDECGTNRLFRRPTAA